MAELPPDTRSEDVSKFFDGYGKIVDCRVMTGWFNHHPSHFTMTLIEMDQVSVSSSLKMPGYTFLCTCRFPWLTSY
jgi:RNA recognition motif. (a.k.a. RRM, RBD, or RNP domain)